MTRIALALFAALYAAPSVAQTSVFPQTIPANTVVGRFGGTTAGPAQAIPFARLGVVPTTAPVLGLVNNVTGSLGLAGITSGRVTMTVQPAAGTWTFKLPANPGSSGQALLTDGNGTTTWGGGTVGCLNNTRLAKTANYTVQSADAGSTIALGGNSFFTLTFSASGYPVATCIEIVNEDAWGTGRAKWITVNGFGTFYLWPTQSALLFVQNNAWQVMKSPRVRLPSGTNNLYSDWTNGSDAAGATDCLATGAGACKSAEQAFLIAAQEFDFSGISQARVQINMAAATLDTQGVHAPVHGMTGAQGGAAVQFVGASLAISALANNGGGLCRITVPATASYATNQIVSTYGIATTTTCNGIFKVTVVDSTHLDLQGSTFSAGTGGTVTNGSGFSTTGIDAMAFYFGTVVQLKNLTLSSDQNGASFTFGSKGYILDGNIFSGSPAGAHIAANLNAIIEIDGSIGIASGGSFAFQGSAGGHLYAATPINVNILAGLNPTFTDFAFASTAGRAVFSNITINTNGNTVTGVRCTANSLGAVLSATGAPNTYFPGNSNCTSAGGGQTL